MIVKQLLECSLVLVEGGGESGGEKKGGVGEYRNGLIKYFERAFFFRTWSDTVPSWDGSHEARRSNRRNIEPVERSPDRCQADGGRFLALCETENSEVHSRRYDFGTFFLGKCSRNSAMTEHEHNLNATLLFGFAGKQRRWDMVFSHDSVAILLYHTQLQAFLLVRQFRPPVYANILRDCEHNKSSSPPSLESAFVFELCAGLVDKPGLSLSEIASEEVMEETGYSVPATALRQVTSFLTSVGLSGSRQTIFAANIDEECLCSPSISSNSSSAAATAGGGGLASHGEAIDVVALPVSSVDDFLLDETVPKSAGLMFSLLWGKERVEANGGRGLF